LFLSFFVFNVLTKKKKKGWERPIENKKEKKKRHKKKGGKNEPTEYVAWFCFFSNGFKSMFRLILR